MLDTQPAQYPNWLHAKHIVFAAIGAMITYVFNHKERFTIDPTNPARQHDASFKWWLLPHGLAGVSAMLLVPMQFSDRPRTRLTRLHRVIVDLATRWYDLPSAQPRTLTREVPRTIATGIAAP
jgi:hypothetical protein